MQRPIMVSSGNPASSIQSMIHMFTNATQAGEDIATTHRSMRASEMLKGGVTRENIARARALGKLSQEVETQLEFGAKSILHKEELESKERIKRKDREAKAFEGRANRTNKTNIAVMKESGQDRRTIAKIGSSEKIASNHDSVSLQNNARTNNTKVALTKFKEAGANARNHENNMVKSTIASNHDRTSMYNTQSTNSTRASIAQFKEANANSRMGAQLASKEKIAEYQVSNANFRAQQKNVTQREIAEYKTQNANWRTLTNNQVKQQIAMMRVESSEGIAKDNRLARAKTTIYKEGKADDRQRKSLENKNAIASFKNQQSWAKMNASQQFSKGEHGKDRELKRSIANANESGRNSRFNTGQENTMTRQNKQLKAQKTLAQQKSLANAKLAIYKQDRQDNRQSASLENSNRKFLAGQLAKDKRSELTNKRADARAKKTNADAWKRFNLKREVPLTAKATNSRVESLTKRHGLTRKVYDNKLKKMVDKPYTAWGRALAPVNVALVEQMATDLKLNNKNQVIFTSKSGKTMLMNDKNIQAEAKLRGISKNLKK